jgi:class 3 adenylate cyclase
MAMLSVHARERVRAWTLIGAAALVAVVATGDAWQRVGTITPGFNLMANLKTGAADRGGVEPFGRIRAVDGQPVRTHAELRALVEARPAGTTFRYAIERDGQLEEQSVPSRRVTLRDFKHFLFDSLLSGLLTLMIASALIVLRPNAAESRLFLGFCLLSSLEALLWTDFNTIHRFARLYLVLWAFAPAVFTHLALTLPERRAIAQRQPWVVWPPYAASSVLAVLLQFSFLDQTRRVAEISAVYWGLSLLALLVSLAWTGLIGPSPLVRQRARVLLVGFAAGYLIPVTATVVEIVSRISVPHLAEFWKLTFVFPLAVAYAIVRYQLFDIRTVLRAGAVYSSVTALVVITYVAVLTVVNLGLAGLDEGTHPLVSAAITASVIVLLFNPLYGRLKAVIDRLFFRDRYDAQQALERLVDAMTTARELPRIAGLIRDTVEVVFRPSMVALFVSEEGRAGYRALPGLTDGGLPGESALLRCLVRERRPLTRVWLRDDPAVSEERGACVRELDVLGAEVVAPVLFRERLIGFLAAGPRRGAAPYTTEDLRFIRLLVNQSAVALENARAYSALQVALRRVELLESIRLNLSKFVPRTVQDLIEQSPRAPELAKHEADVSVLFVDLVGYTRLSEHLDAPEVNEMVERCFGAFLDEIIDHSGDVNETAGDGLMVIFKDPDPSRHARAAVLTALGILRRAREMSADPSMPATVALRLGVNSGPAAVGATKIQGRAGARWTYTASGPVTNIAARLAGLGPADTVLIGPETCRRLDADFRPRDLGEHQLKNVDEPVRVFGIDLEEPSPVPALGLA